MFEWYDNFKKKYIVQQRRPQEYLVNRYYAHLIDPFLTKVAFDMKLSPNVITVIAGIVGIMASVFFASNMLVVGAVMLQFYHLLDCVDGNIARLTNRCTPLGAKLDKLVDQIVRVILFVSIAYISTVPLWIKILFVGTIYIDLYVIHLYVLPFLKKNKIIRSRWKEWFLSKGLIPAFDIFLVYVLISIFAVLDQINMLVYVVIIGKNLDWFYRVWECLKTKWIAGRVK